MAMRWDERCGQKLTCKEGSLEKKSPYMTWVASKILARIDAGLQEDW